jgi:hypothetical protein
MTMAIRVNKKAVKKKLPRYFRMIYQSDFQFNRVLIFPTIVPVKIPSSIFAAVSTRW